MPGQVNLALVLDGSSGIDDEEFALEQDFAEDTVTAFAARNLFANGGTASYVQFSDMLVSSGTFDSAEAFIEFSDNDYQDAGGGRIASIGITEGTVRLLATEAAAWFMIVITDGISSNVAETTVAADAARAEGITVFAVGVGEIWRHHLVMVAVASVSVRMVLACMSLAYLHGDLAFVTVVEV